MSWLDSSFGFAKTALSQAQKSIDKVLDIQDGQENKGVPEENKDGEKVDGSAIVEEIKSTSDSPRNQSNNSSWTTADSFVSTWGSMDSFWGSKSEKSPKTNEPTPKRKMKPKSSSVKSVNASKTDTPTTHLTTPPTNVHATQKDPPTPINPLAVNEPTSNLTSTPKSGQLADTQKDLVDGGCDVTTDSDKNKDLSVQEPVEQLQTDNQNNKNVVLTATDAVCEEEETKRMLRQENKDNLSMDNEPGSPEVEGSLQGKDSGARKIKADRKQETETKNSIKLEEERKAQEKQKEMEKDEEKMKDQQRIHKKIDAVSREKEDEDEVVLVVHDEGTKTGVSEAVNSTTSTASATSSVSTASTANATSTTTISTSTSTEAAVQPGTDDGVGAGGTNESKDTNTVNTASMDSAGCHTDEDRLAAIEMELVQVKDLLKVREAKVLEQSEQLVKLQQTNQEMQRCLDDFKRQIEKMDDSKDELTRRVTTGEEKIQTLTKERNSLKKQLQALSNEKNDSSEKRLTELLKEKDEMIAGLMEEGEKLSKQELQSNNTIKKLRAREKQNESAITTQKQQIEDFEAEIRKLKDTIKRKEEIEQKYQESLSQMNSMIEQQSKELNQIKPERDELQERARSLQANLDSTYKELTELRKSNALSQSAVEEATVSAQQIAKESLKKELEEQRLVGEREKDTLMLQINELRLSLTRTEQQSTWREDQLRQEISDLHKRIQESEGRNQDLSDTISDATRPLLRQIEHLRSAQAAQASNWERLENSLTQRLVESHTQLNSATEKERNAVEKLLTLQSRVSSLEDQLKSVRQERSQLMASLETERTKLSTMEETYQREISRHETYRQNVQQSVDELKKEKESLQRQLDYERVRLEAESRKADLESQEKEKLRNQLAMSLTSSSVGSVSRQSSTSTPNENLRTLNHHSIESISSDLNSILRVPGGSFSSASAFEHLQTLLKQKEGELTNSQEMVASLERSRSAITEELTKITASNEALKKEVEIIPELKQKLVETTQKHEALLQMFGEKVEEAEELRLDIQDLKTMYRQQIEELVCKR